MNLLYLSIIVGFGHVIVEAAVGIVGDTYSCFKEFEDIATDGCAGRIEAEDGTIIQTSMVGVDDMDFCVSGPVYGQAKQGSFGKAKNYAASADLRMEDMGVYSTGYGFTGLAFNMMDSKNYEIAYVRPHTDEHCWELGYVDKGKLFGRKSGKCTSDIGREFNIAVHLENGKASLYVQGSKVTEFSPFYPAVNKVATVMRNNIQSKLSVKNVEICQEIKCVSRNADGKTVVTSPGKFYQDRGMSECEACSCKLYGQVRCGCKTAAEQGVTCTGNTIAAAGPDCCARCVPPFATCYASGDPHYKTFDNNYFNFQGKCSYCLVKTADFEVRHKNFGGGSVSYNEYCMILFDGDQYDMKGTLYHHSAGQTGSVALGTPYKKYFTNTDYIYCPSGTLCEIHIAGVKALTVNCNMRRSANIQIHGTYYEKTECMCGTWNGNPSDDFKDREGKATSVYGMAASWQVANAGDSCPVPPETNDPCDEVSREVRNFAEQYCGRYKREPFKSCPVDVTQAFKSCMFDACIDPNNDNNICENANAYAKQCHAAGHPIVGWRSSSFCPLPCGDTEIFNSCGKGCYPTCEDPNPADCSDVCTEGCYCPPGMVLQDGECIDSSDCQCSFEGKIVESGASWNETARCETCECMDGGVIDCSPQSCPACPEGEVPVSFVGSCCPACLADWTEEKEGEIEVTEENGPVVFECILDDQVLVSPDDITWKNGQGEELTTDTLPDNYKFDEEKLTLTINPAYLHDEQEYFAEVVFNGVVGECQFNLIVNEIPPANYIDLEGDSPIVVREGECATMSVEVVGDIEFDAGDFDWNHGPAQLDQNVNFDDPRFTLTNGGKTLQICDAVEDDEGNFDVCVTANEITDCVLISLKVVTTCDTDLGVKEEEDEWRQGKFTACTCTTTGEVICECIEQDAECTDTEEAYYDPESCELLCSRLPANCLVTGDPHYTSFDGHRHDFQGGNCRFTMVKTPDFEIIGTNVHRDENTNVAWNDAVELVFKAVKVWMGLDGEVKINGEDASLPYEKIWRGQEHLTVFRAGSNVIVSLDLGNGLEALDLVWDGNSTVSTTIHGKYFGETQGLCGTWDENKDNDQIGKDGEAGDIADFGWSWKQSEDTCETEPQGPHPCDELAFGPVAEEIADGACDILNGAPFTACHAVVDPATTIYNCKYDTCACFDASCACHAVKLYVKQCLEAGVQGLDAWRDIATYCPLDCDDGLFYEPCGSFCPATCGNKDADCGTGNLAGQCNEGCFCPQGTYLQEGKCVDGSECQCEHNGEIKSVGDMWEDSNICKSCMCREGGEVLCESPVCPKCSKKEQAVYETDEACCVTCVEEWLVADQEDMLDATRFMDLTLSCTSVVKPFNVAWFYSPDEGETWEEIAGANKLVYTIPKVTDVNDGIYRCKAKKSFKSKTAEIKVKVAAAATSCTPDAPENGAVEPEEVEIGSQITYSCLPGFALNGEPKATCERTGNVDNVAVSCIEATVEQVSFGDYNAKSKKGKVNLTCGTKNKGFGEGASISFYFQLPSGDLELISDSPKFELKKGKPSWSLKGVATKGKPRVVVCEGTNEAGTMMGTGKISLTGK